jgi:hypothetical protein
MSKNKYQQKVDMVIIKRKFYTDFEYIEKNAKTLCEIGSIFQSNVAMLDWLMTS